MRGLEVSPWDAQGESFDPSENFLLLRGLEEDRATTHYQRHFQVKILSPFEGSKKKRGANGLEYLTEFYPEVLSKLPPLIRKERKLTPEERSFLKKAEELCELEIIGKWEDRDSKAFKDLCSTYFDLATLLGPHCVHDETSAYECVKVIVLGYLGERWDSLRQYLQTVKISEVEGMKWDQKVLVSVLAAIVRLVKGDSSHDLYKAVEIVKGLRGQQEKQEKDFLLEYEEEDRVYASVRLISLYHFAAGVEKLAKHLIGKQQEKDGSEVVRHVRIARDCAERINCIVLFLILQYVEALFLKMIEDGRKTDS